MSVGLILSLLSSIMSFQQCSFKTFKMCFMYSAAMPCCYAVSSAQQTDFPCEAYRQALKLGELKEFGALASF